MASTAVAGVGTEFRRWGGSTNPHWVAIAEINSITGPGMSRDTIDVTSLDSTGGYREFITGFRNAGTITLAMNFTRDTYETMLTDFESNVHQNYEISLPDIETTTWEFQGLVTELPLNIPADDKITADVTIQISGQVIINSASGSGHGTSIVH
jgi:predicted secreted protein